MATEFLKFRGKIKYGQFYTPDEFRGAVRWKVNFYPESEEELKRLREAINPNKKVKEDEDGKYIPLYRPTTKFMAGKVVNFTPPHILDKDGDPLVQYVNETTGKKINSYDDPKTKIKRIGEPVLIGNGSEVEITLSVYQTAMGPGNRLEVVRVLDLIEYVPPDDQGTTTSDSDDEEAPW